MTNRTTDRTTEKLQDYVYKELISQINSGKLVVGETYSESKLATEIGVSRSPVRAALQQLHQEGMIEVLPSRGFKLHELTQADVIETFELRCAIEGFCCMKIANERDLPQVAEFLKEMSSLLEKQRELAKDGDFLEEFLVQDMAFHALIIAYSKNRCFEKLFQEKQNTILHFARFSFSKKEGMLLQTVGEHMRIFNALSDGNSNSAYTAIITHLKTPMRNNLDGFNSKNIKEK